MKKMTSAYANKLLKLVIMIACGSTVTCVLFI